MQVKEWQFTDFTPATTGSRTLRRRAWQSTRSWARRGPRNQSRSASGRRGHFIDWHPAPRRQYIISLRGEIEIGLGDGTTFRYGPGDARLVEDTTGQGHTTRVVSDTPSLTAVVPLA